MNFCWSTIFLIGKKWEQIWYFLNFRSDLEPDPDPYVKKRVRNTARGQNICQCSCVSVNFVSVLSQSVMMKPGRVEGVWGEAGPAKKSQVSNYQHRCVIPPTYLSENVSVKILWQFCGSLNFPKLTKIRKISQNVSENFTKYFVKFCFLLTVDFATNYSVFMFYFCDITLQL